MNDVKFACPHCSQHIACDGDYAELSIECPSCGGTLVVPRLMGASSEHGRMVIVASSTPSSPRPTQRIPRPAFLGEQFGQETEENPAMTTLWLGSLFGTLVLAFVLVGNGFGLKAAVACVVLGGILTGFLRAKGTRQPVAQALLSGLGFAVVLVVVAPVLALGILFVGCTACAQ